MKTKINTVFFFMFFGAIISLRAFPMHEEGEGNSEKKKDAKEVSQLAIEEKTEIARRAVAGAEEGNDEGPGQVPQDGLSAADAKQTQLTEQEGQKKSAAMCDWGIEDDGISAPVIKMPSRPVVLPLSVTDQVKEIMGKMAASDVTGYLPVRKGGHRIGSIQYTQHGVEQMAENTLQNQAAFKKYNARREGPSDPPKYRAIPHEEVESLLRNPNIKVIGGIESNPTLAIQERDHPGSLIVRIIRSELSNGIIKIQTAFRPQDNRDQALGLVQQAETILKNIDPTIDIVTRWNDAGILFYESSTKRSEVNDHVRGILDLLSEKDKDKVMQLLNQAWELCNEADREESRG